MTTDLKSMTVEELCEKALYTRLAAYEIARRLEEAQQKIVAQQARLRKFKMDVFEYLVVRGEGTEEYANLMAHSSLIQNDEAEANEALAANDAELTAKAKAEALEEFMLQFGDEDCPPRLVDDALAKAAEYRAKAGRKE